MTEHNASIPGEALLPLVYEELRRLAAAKLAQEGPGLTLQPTALVHEAFLRLLRSGVLPNWEGQGHFFMAAAEAMRRILVERARRKKRLKHGGDRLRVELNLDLIPSPTPKVDLPALDEALARLEALRPTYAQLVKLRFFAGMPVAEAAQALGISVATAERYWAFARGWLYAELNGSDHPSSGMRKTSKKP